MINIFFSTGAKTHCGFLFCSPLAGFSLRRHTIALDVNIECNLSQADGLFVVFSFPGQPDHRILHTVTFSCGEILTTVSSEIWWPISKTRRRELIPIFYRFFFRNAATYVAEISRLLGSCKLEKLCHVL